MAKRDDEKKDGAWRKKAAEEIFNKLPYLKALCQKNGSDLDGLDKIKMEAETEPMLLLKVDNERGSSSSGRSYFGLIDQEIGYSMKLFLDFTRAEIKELKEVLMMPFFQIILPLFKGFDETKSFKALLELKYVDDKYFDLALDERVGPNSPPLEVEEHNKELLGKLLHSFQKNIGAGNLVGKWQILKQKLSDINLLFVDKCKQIGKPEEWAKIYDAREPGCLNDMLQAYDKSIFNRPSNKELEEGDKALGFFLQINDFAMESQYIQSKKVDKVATHATSFNVVPNILVYSKEGIVDWKAEQYFLNTKNLAFLKNEGRSAISEGEKMWELSLRPSNEKKPLGITFNRTPEKALSCLSGILHSYYSHLSAEEDPCEKLKILVDTYGKLERLHIREDGNTRTSLTWVNIELMNMGFPPAIMYDPNLVACRSSEVVLDQVISGMQTLCKEMEKSHDEIDDHDLASAHPPARQVAEGDKASAGAESDLFLDT